MDEDAQQTSLVQAEETSQFVVFVYWIHSSVDAIEFTQHFERKCLLAIRLGFPNESMTILLVIVCLTAKS